MKSGGPQPTTAFITADGIDVPVAVGTVTNSLVDLLEDPAVRSEAKVVLRDLIESGALAANDRVNANPAGVRLDALTAAARRAHDPAKCPRGRPLTSVPIFIRNLDRHGGLVWIQLVVSAGTARALRMLLSGPVTMEAIQRRIAAADFAARLRELRAVGARVATLRLALPPATRPPQRKRPRPRPQLLLLSAIRFDLPADGASIVTAKQLADAALGAWVWAPQFNADAVRWAKLASRRAAAAAGRPANVARDLIAPSLAAEARRQLDEALSLLEKPLTDPEIGARFELVAKNADPVVGLRLLAAVARPGPHGAALAAVEVRRMGNVLARRLGFASFEELLAAIATRTRTA